MSNLPISKVKKISKLTNPNHQITVQAAQSITFCTEYITKFLMEQSQKVVISNQKKTIMYDDVRKVVEETVGLQFLDDTVPIRWVTK
ncbi:Histone-like transcription factor (CBF/NF-Y) [Spironucleus salmonicida]|uniref:Histone-like transcription factor (CBF/NF-Y) n=1 Tax=Spironucleus salmonicida TaxID=348837 RepID=V6LWR6_9EUKA|nr:Histone-like transcription factor (CBF/NF-Y) [Spironucleus salmonicida]|eukprot:EST48663.1 Histone-like transcription factor (CBF/NF-Y) [Spironucleus salmonicida]